MTTGKAGLSRAEIVRQRRAQRSHAATARSGGESLRPMNVITTRDPRTASHGHAVGDMATRRPGTLQGAHPRTRLHPLFGVRPGWRLISLLVSVLFGLGLYLSLTLSYFQVSSPLISGNTRIGTDELEQTLGATGQSIFSIRPDELATRLRLNYPELASANVKVFLPNKVWLQVSERVPLIRWQQADGYTWIDASGVAFRPRGEMPGLIAVEAWSDPPATHPGTVDPLSPPPFLAADLVEGIRALAPHAPPDTVLTYDEANGLGWRDSRGWEVAFGVPRSDILLKLKVYESLVSTLVAKGVYPEYISVVYESAPYYRLSGDEQECSGLDESCASLDSE